MGFFRKTKDIITLFHKASSPGSKRVAALLKQAQVEAAEKDLRPEFDLEVTEQPPTLDQVKTILDYVGQPGISSVIKGATSENEALQKFKQSADSFQKPLVVDWANGKAHVGENESEILKMLNALPKK
ncbi:hypothetical protein QC762_114430 [Podospora pseudocomata]|uniref:Uncharacterized protein n=1 Tax=Podospora pseudocomata TaxID=2093779 RepID=A0ABR0GW43_9PEZI|nr:hypothetical protein QC762_114430 [Podospora pseudocomata]